MSKSGFAANDIFVSRSKLQDIRVNLWRGFGKGHIAALMSALLAFTTPAYSSDRTEVLSKITEFVEAWNRDDANTVLNSMMESPAIIDDFTHRVWTGPTAVKDWAESFKAFKSKNAISGYSVELQQPGFVSTDAEKGYVVIDALYKYKQQGSPRQDRGTLIVGLRKMENAWQISGFVWTKD
jgi:ketosteroid isomerase-like protein